MGKQKVQARLEVVYKRYLRSVITQTITYRYKNCKLHEA